jgi:hypothetical protein
MKHDGVLLQIEPDTVAAASGSIYWLAAQVPAGRLSAAKVWLRMSLRWDSRRSVFDIQPDTDASGPMPPPSERRSGEQ